MFCGDITPYSSLVELSRRQPNRIEVVASVLAQTSKALHDSGVEEF